MIPHEIITPFSLEWWIFNTINVIVIYFILIAAKQISKKSQAILTKSLAIIFISEFFIMDWLHMFNGIWTVKDSLPLHLCSIMWFLSIYFFLLKKQWAFEMLLFIGMPGAVHSLLTPELTHGGDLLHKIDFFIGHGGLILAPLYGVYAFEMWPKKNGWWKTFLKLQIIVLCVFFANYLFDSNYMYLSYPPIANNPLIPRGDSFFADWPYYILIFEIAILIHVICINFICSKIKKSI